MVATPLRRRGAVLDRCTTFVRGHVPEALLGLGLLLQAVLATVLASRLWFRGDDWDFLLSRGTVPGENVGWFVPHADHWQTGVIAIYRILFPIFGMRHYVPYAMVVIVLHVVACALLYAVLVRHGVSRWVALVTVWVAVFLGVAAETFLWDTPMALLAPLVLALVALLLAGGPTLSQRHLADIWILLCLGLMFYGAALTLCAFVAAYVALRHGLRSGLKVVAVPAVVFGSWYVWVGHTGSEGIAKNLWDYGSAPDYVWQALTYALEKGSGVAGSGAILLIVLSVAPFVARQVPAPLRSLAIAGVLASVLQLTLAFATPNRLAVADVWVKSGRYAYLTYFFLAPSVALCLGLLARQLRVQRWVVAAFAAVLLALYTVHGVGLEHRYYVGERVFANYWPPRLVAVVQADRDGERVLTTTPANFIDKGMDPHMVVTPTIRRNLPDVHPTAKQRLDAELNYFVGVGKKTYDLFNPGSMTAVFGFASPMDQSLGCHAAHSDFGRPALELTSSDGVEIGVASRSTEVTTQLVRDGVKSAVRVWQVDKGQVHIATSAKDATLVVVGSSRVDLQACKLEYSIVSPK